jgi:uncharacterized protein (DUF1501 family)
MAATKKDPVLVVLQLSGGNDYLNSVIPYNNPLYRDNRPAVGIPDDQILHLDKDYGFHPSMAPLKKIWDEGKLAIMHGVGYANSPRSHFAPWTSGTPVSPIKWGPKAGWVVWRVNSTRRRKTWSPS